MATRLDAQSQVCGRQSDSACAVVRWYLGHRSLSGRYCDVCRDAHVGLPRALSGPETTKKVVEPVGWLSTTIPSGSTQV